MRTLVVGRDPAAVEMDKSVDRACVVKRASRRRVRRQHVAAAVADLRRA
jgi:hypothetical protein